MLTADRPGMIIQINRTFPEGGRKNTIHYTCRVLWEHPEILKLSKHWDMKGTGVLFQLV